MIPVCLQVAGASPQPQPTPTTTSPAQSEVTTRVLSVNIQSGYTGATLRTGGWMNGVAGGLTVAYSYGHFGIGGFVHRFVFEGRGIDSYMAGVEPFYANNWGSAYFRTGLQLGVGNTEFPDASSPSGLTIRGEAFLASNTTFGYAPSFGGEPGFRLDLVGVSARAYLANYYVGFDVSAYLDLGLILAALK